MQVRAQKTIYNDTIDILMFEKNGDGSISYIDNFMMTKLEPNQVAANPSLKLDYISAQQMIDALWDCGLRPSEGSGSAGALAATERHLKDMQELVFKRHLVRNAAEPKPLT